jgi:hypothetical protein
MDVFSTYFDVIRNEIAPYEDTGMVAGMFQVATSYRSKDRETPLGVSRPAFHAAGRVPKHLTLR